MHSSHEFHVKKRADRNRILNTYIDILKMYT